jgi:predicted MFS family arabinose efflux permease
VDGRQPGTPKRLEVTLTCGFLLLVSGLSVGVVLPELRDEFSLSATVAAAHVSTFGFGLILMAFAGVALVRRVGRQRMFWCAAAAIAAGVTMLCAGPVWPITLAGCVIAGLGCATLVQLMPGLVADGFAEHRGAAFARINAWPGLAGVCYALAVGAVLSFGGSWRWPFFGLMLSTLVALVGLGRTVTLPVAAPHDTNLLAALRRPDVRGPWAGVVLAVMLDFPPGQMAILFLRDVGKVSSGTAAMLGAGWGVFLFTGRLLIPRVRAALGEWTVVAIYSLELAGVLVMWVGPGLAVRVVGMAMVALGSAPAYVLAVDRLYDETDGDPAVLGSVAALASGLAISIGTLGLGALTDVFSTRHAILSVAVLAALGITLRWPRRRLLDTVASGSSEVDRLQPSGQQPALRGAP